MKLLLGSVLLCFLVYIFFESTKPLSDTLFAAIVAVFPTKKYTPETTETRNSVSLLAIEHQIMIGNIIATKPLFSVNGYLFPLVSTIYTTKPAFSIRYKAIYLSIIHRSRSDTLASKIATLHLKIAPIICVVSGEPHSAYPNTMLEFWLLTEARLDMMAHYYSQSTPSKYTNMYPRTMGWDKGFLSSLGEDQATTDGRYQLSTADRIAIKRRKFARFIGMRGCEIPGWGTQAHIRALEYRVVRSLQEEERSAIARSGFEGVEV